MTKKEWVYMFTIGFITAALVTVRGFYYFRINTRGMAKNTYEILPQLLIVKFIGVFFVICFVVWILFQLIHLFRKEKRGISESAIPKKHYVIEFLKITGLFILTVLWIIFSIYTFVAYKQHKEASQGFRLFLYINLILIILGIIELYTEFLI